MSTSKMNEQEIFSGTDNPSFKKFVVSLLERSTLKKEYIDMLVSEQNMVSYKTAFTAVSANEDNNYDIFEQLGDLSANKFIVWYAYDRFPVLKCTLGVKVVARLRINYGSRSTFAKIADDLGFWPYITACVDDRMRKKKDLLEDCFESFLGCTEQLLDNLYKPGVGYGIVYGMLSTIFNRIPMSLNYKDLYDSKTRLKELFDAYKDLGTWTYIDNRDGKLAESRLYMVPSGCRNRQPIKKVTGPCKSDVVSYPHHEWIYLGKGLAAKKADAQQKAAEAGLIELNKKGYNKEVTGEYKRFAQSANQDAFKKKSRRARNKK